MEISIGNRYGRLIVLSSEQSYKSPPKPGKKQSCRKQWLCLCDCGNKIIASGTKLRNGKIYQCASCGYKSRPQSAIKIDPAYRLYQLSILTRVAKTDILLDLPFHIWQKIVSEKCVYCGKKPQLKPYANNVLANGIDRIDSSKGYTVDNCVSCCSLCNHMKGALSKEDFLNHIERILEYTFTKVGIDDRYTTVTRSD